MQLPLEKVNTWIRAASIAILLYLFMGFPALARDNLGLDMQPEPKLLRACTTAYLDFSSQMKSSGGDTDFGKFMSDVDNYKITAYSEENFFVVEFSPKPFHGVLVRGGVSRYTIDETGKKILELQKFR